MAAKKKKESVNSQSKKISIALVGTAVTSSLLTTLFSSGSNQGLWQSYQADSGVHIQETRPNDSQKFSPYSVRTKAGEFYFSHGKDGNFVFSKGYSGKVSFERKDLDHDGSLETIVTVAPSVDGVPLVGEEKSYLLQTDGKGVPILREYEVTPSKIKIK